MLEIGKVRRQDLEFFGGGSKGRHFSTFFRYTSWSGIASYHVSTKLKQVRQRQEDLWGSRLSEAHHKRLVNTDELYMMEARSPVPLYLEQNPIDYASEELTAPHNLQAFQFPEELTSVLLFLRELWTYGFCVDVFLTQLRVASNILSDCDIVVLRFLWEREVRDVLNLSWSTRVIKLPQCRKC